MLFFIAEKKLPKSIEINILYSIFHLYFIKGIYISYLGGNPMERDLVKKIFIVLLLVTILFAVIWLATSIPQIPTMIASGIDPEVAMFFNPFFIITIICAIPATIFELWLRYGKK